MTDQLSDGTYGVWDIIYIKKKKKKKIWVWSVYLLHSRSAFIVFVLQTHFLFAFEVFELGREGSEPRLQLQASAAALLRLRVV